MDNRPLTTILIPFNNYVYELSFDQTLKNDPLLAQILGTFTLSKISTPQNPFK